MELREKIQRKKDELGKVKKFQPITSCILPNQDGTRSSINIHTLNKSRCVDIMVDINMRLLSAKDLGVEDDFVMSGFKATDWIEDLKGKLTDINKKEEEKKLKLMEDKLTKLLSEEKQTSLQIEEIESLL